MADNRKTLESIPVPASGAAPNPVASTPAASEGASTGGIARTADSALGESIGLTGDVPAIGPNTSGGAESSRTGATPSAPPSRRPSAEELDAQTPEDESPLESLGKAIGAPLSGEALAKEPRR